MVDNTANASPVFGIKTWLGTSWVIVRQHWPALVFAAFVRELLALLAGGVAFAICVEWRGWNLLVALAVRFLAWSALQPGYLRFCLNLCENSRAQWKDLLSGLPNAIAMLFATACLWAAVALGLVLLVVPGLMLAVRCSLYGFVLVDQNLGALKSLLNSHRMLRGFAKYATLLLFVYSIGVSLCGWLAGALEAIFVVSLCTLYRHIKPEGTAQ